ncbi:hypothetical protein LZ554_002521 [Drepanopeziza brunnea f. sp. 'monogermtubi']|nr:hypothetical protein LZ554_002521 [Drepanopeziza brunnea f. sp. 'monogermtubi']
MIDHINRSALLLCDVEPYANAEDTLMASAEVQKTFLWSSSYNESMSYNSDYDDGEGDIEMDGFSGIGFSGGTGRLNRSEAWARPQVATSVGISRNFEEFEEQSVSTKSSVPDDVYSSHSRDSDESTEEICDDNGPMMAEKGLEESDSVPSESVEPTFVSFGEL